MDPTNNHAALVTGASGFIGRRLVRRLLERDVPVTCLVRSKPQAGDLERAGARVILGDVTDPLSVERALTDSRAASVFHLAGLVRAPNSQAFAAVNAGGVERIAAACSTCAVPPVLVVVSSLAAAGTSPANQPRQEDQGSAPVSMYGRSKLAGEQAAAKHAGSVPITIVRPPIVFGPQDRGVLELFRAIARWGVHLAPGGVSPQRRLSLIFVDDLVNALLLAALNGERMDKASTPGRGVYFIAAQEHPTHEQLGVEIAAAMGKGPPGRLSLPGPLLQLIGLASDVASRFGGKPTWLGRDKVTEVLAQESWTCSSEKARQQLGWRPAAGLTDRLRETVEWYRGAGWL